MVYAESQSTLVGHIWPFQFYYFRKSKCSSSDEGLCSVRQWVAICPQCFVSAERVPLRRRPLSCFDCLYFEDRDLHVEFIWETGQTSPEFDTLSLVSILSTGLVQWVMCGTGPRRCVKILFPIKPTQLKARVRNVKCPSYVNWLMGILLTLYQLKTVSYVFLHHIFYMDCFGVFTITDPRHGCCINYWHLFRISGITITVHRSYRGRGFESKSRYEYVCGLCVVCR
jgi:hypothetical protein